MFAEQVIIMPSDLCLAIKAQKSSGERRLGHPRFQIGQFLDKALSKQKFHPYKTQCKAAKSFMVAGYE